VDEVVPGDEEEEDVEGVEEPEAAQEGSNASSLYRWPAQCRTSVERRKCFMKGVL